MSAIANIAQVLDAAPQNAKSNLTADQIRIRNRAYADKWIEKNRDSINVKRRAKKAAARKLLSTPPREVKVRELKPAIPKLALERYKLTQARLKELFSYNPETGIFTRLTARGNCPAGSSSGWPGPRGYLMLAVDKHDYYVARLAWLYMTGAWPNGDIDHINGEITSNRWSNLRDVTKSTNSENQRKAHKNNISGFLGVASKKTGYFVAHITVRGERRYLGQFKDAESASAAYLNAKRESHEGCTI